MSSCFLCDTSYKFTENDKYSFVVGQGGEGYKYHFMKYMPIMPGSVSTIYREDQQHDGVRGYNYLSYRVKRIEFRASVIDPIPASGMGTKPFPDYIILFKVPRRDPIFDYYFTLLKEFILFSEPESVLTYGVYKTTHSYVEPAPALKSLGHSNYDLIVDKPFIVGPTDYVGVLYMFERQVIIDSSAKVWFDVV